MIARIIGSRRCGVGKLSALAEDGMNFHSQLGLECVPGSPGCRNVVGVCLDRRVPSAEAGLESRSRCGMESQPSRTMTK